MGGFGFIVPGLLWALPLAALPLLLHVLFRKRSPVVVFPTLRFIKTSFQQTAARRRIQRWLLLALRMLMLAALIIAIAQPFRSSASSLLGTSDKSIVAAIVIDTSYSMLDVDHAGGDGAGATRLEAADGIVTDLLKGSLGGARTRVAIFKNTGAKGEGEPALVSAGAILKDWVGLKAAGEPAPLETKVAAAVDLLSRQQADERWLIVVSDLQGREFPASFPKFDGRAVVFDLQPTPANSDGIAGIGLEPAQPIPGIGVRINVAMTGRALANQDVKFSISKLDGTSLKELQDVPQSLDETGTAVAPIDVMEGLPSVDATGEFQRWLLLTASFAQHDGMTWDDQRTLLVEVPAKQKVMVMDSPGQPRAEFLIQSALGSSRANWPLVVNSGPDLKGDEQVVVQILSAWPSEATAGKMAAFAQRGGTVILVLQPGLEVEWGALGDAQKKAILGVIPSAPLVKDDGSGIFHAEAGAMDDELLAGLTDKSFDMSGLIVRRFVPLSKPADASVTTVLKMSSDEPADSRTYGLLFRKTVGQGVVYSLATVPDPTSYSNFLPHPLGLPLLVNMALSNLGQRNAQNVEVGQAISIAPYQGAAITLSYEPRAEDGKDLTGAEYAFGGAASNSDATFNWDKKNQKLTFLETGAPGLYLWKDQGGAVIGASNVNYPAEESQMVYKSGKALVSGIADAMVVRSYEDFEKSMSRSSEPNRQYTPILGLVLLLLCFEALLGNLSEFWKAKSVKVFGPKTAG